MKAFVGGAHRGRARVVREVNEEGVLAAMAQAGVASSGADPAVRAAFLMANDLAVLLLRDQLTAILGVDPLSPEGMSHWAAEVLAVYRGGLGSESASQPARGGEQA